MTWERSSEHLANLKTLTINYEIYQKQHVFYRLLTSLCSDILMEINQDHIHSLNAT